MAIITLNLNGEKDILIAAQYLLKVPESKLAKYFTGNPEAQKELSPWIIRVHIFLFKAAPARPTF